MEGWLQLPVRVQRGSLCEWPAFLGPIGILEVPSTHITFEVQRRGAGLLGMHPNVDQRQSRGKAVAGAPWQMLTSPVRHTFFTRFKDN